MVDKIKYPKCIECGLTEFLTTGVSGRVSNMVIAVSNGKVSNIDYEIDGQEAPYFEHDESGWICMEDHKVEEPDMISKLNAVVKAFEEE